MLSRSRMAAAATLAPSLREAPARTGSVTSWPATVTTYPERRCYGPGTDRTCDLGTEHAVEKHIRSIFQKLHIDSGPDDHRRVLTVLAFLRSS